MGSILKEYLSPSREQWFFGITEAEIRLVLSEGANDMPPITKSFDLTGHVFSSLTRRLSFPTLIIKPNNYNPEFENA